MIRIIKEKIKETGTKNSKKKKKKKMLVKPEKSNNSNSSVIKTHSFLH